MTDEKRIKLIKKARRKLRDVMRHLNDAECPTHAARVKIVRADIGDLMHYLEDCIEDTTHHQEDI